MPNVCYQFSNILFQTIYESLFYYLNVPEDKIILYLISPWLHDIYNKDPINKSYVSNIFSNISLNFNDIDSFSSIIRTLLTQRDSILQHHIGNRQIGEVEIIIVTSIYYPKTLKKDNPVSNSREAKFLLKVLDWGGDIYFHNDSHAKMLITTTHSLSGSANLTVPGLFQHSENVTLHPRGMEREYLSDFNRARDLIHEAKTNPKIDNIRNYIEQHIQ